MAQQQPQEVAAPSSGLSREENHRWYRQLLGVHNTVWVPPCGYYDCGHYEKRNRVIESSTLTFELVEKYGINCQRVFPFVNQLVATVPNLSITKLWQLAAIDGNDQAVIAHIGDKKGVFASGSPLHFAALGGQKECIEKLRAHYGLGFDGKTKPFYGGMLPQHFAAIGGHGQLIHDLVAEYHLDIMEQSAKGENCYDIAIRAGQSECVKQLLELNPTKMSGNVLQRAALQKGSLKVVAEAFCDQLLRDTMKPRTSQRKHYQKVWSENAYGGAKQQVWALVCDYTAKKSCEKTHKSFASSLRDEVYSKSFIDDAALHAFVRTKMIELLERIGNNKSDYNGSLLRRLRFALQQIQSTHPELKPAEPVQEPQRNMTTAL